jgi:hypothetical protein
LLKMAGLEKLLWYTVWGVPKSSRNSSA